MTRYLRLQKIAKVASALAVGVILVITGMWAIGYAARSANAISKSDTPQTLNQDKRPSRVAYVTPTPISSSIGIYVPLTILRGVSNSAPRVTTPESPQSIADEWVELAIVAEDPEKDALRYEAVNLPMGLAIHPDTGEISGFTLLTGTYTTTVTVTDAKSNATSVTFRWDVLEQEPVVLPEVNGSVARLWNEVLLDAIRNDYARPTVHARNLFHSSIGMYDAWAAYDNVALPYLLGRESDEVVDYSCPWDQTDLFVPADTASLNAAREESISYAVYRILEHRFDNSPGSERTVEMADLAMNHLGYDPSITSVDYELGPAQLGNYLGNCIIDHGLQDGSNEVNDYSNLHYEPVNQPLRPHEPGNTTAVDPHRWQPLELITVIDQAGNPIADNTPDFLSPEWGRVAPFALTEDMRTEYTRDGYTYWVYHDPGPPPMLNGDVGHLPDEYKWGFALVSIWGSHLDSNDETVWDISPASIGNAPILPETAEGLRSFYELLEGGDTSHGRTINPVTQEGYMPQMVKRGDYARVLAEFWADGPDSETPPGHWFTILNYVNDHLDFEKKYRGRGEPLGHLEWDVKAYFALGGAMHDAAVAAWGIKGWYDYIRPVSAIRYMAEKGQSSDENLPRFHPDGLPLVENYIELVEAGDPLAGAENDHVNKIKLYTWKGPDYVSNPATDEAGVGWILAENWWPYQRPSFVTPPFAGYVSGHSTYSRAAAELLTMLTGDEYFPGGIGEFSIQKNNFLVFEEGPSVDIILQWATYRDASDQCSLSRIWGGIHPPADDIPGRRIGARIGTDAFELADKYFRGATRSQSE